MSSEAIPKEVLALIRHHIEAVEQLEILLLLFTQRERDWSAEEVARTLRSSNISAAKWLDELATKEFLIEKSDSKSRRYQFASEKQRVLKDVAALAEAYLVRRVTVIDLIFSKPIDKLKIFADAFKLREDK